MTPPRFFLAVFAAALVLAGPSAFAAETNSQQGVSDVFAVVIGHNGGERELAPLRFADDDAARFTLLLRSLASAPENVVLLTTFDEASRKELGTAGLTLVPDGPPTREAVASAFARLGQRLAAWPPGAPPPTFFFIYAGHGVRGRVVLAPKAGEEAGLTGLELRHQLAALGRRFAETRPGDTRLPTFVFLDACRSQSLFLERGDGAAVGPDLTGEATALTEEAESLPLGIMTAAVAGQPTGEMAALGGGLFSHVLTSGLAGAADANADRRVSFAELAAFVAFNTGQPATRQPWFAPPGGRLSATVLDLRGAKSGLDFTGAPAGRYVVGAASGRPLFAELVSSGRTRARLVVPQGRYRLTYAPEGHPRRAAEVDVTAGGTAAMGALAWHDPGADEAPRGPELDETAAFKEPFTAEAVSTLTVAYEAGRQPAALDRAAENRLSVGGLWASAPLGLVGSSWGLAARWTHTGAPVGPWFVPRLAFGAGALVARSSHQAGGVDFSLESYEAHAYLGPLWNLGPAQMALFVEGGGGPLLRRGSDGVSGDGFAPVLGVAARVAYPWTPHGHVELGVAAMERWVDIDGASERHAHWRAEAGLGWSLP